MKLTRLPQCPEIPLVHIAYDGHWTNPIFELFANEEGSPAVHLHVYKRSRFLQMKSEFPWKNFPALKTISWDL